MYKPVMLLSQSVCLSLLKNNVQIGKKRTGTLCLRTPKVRRVSMQLGGLGSAVSSPSGSGQSPVDKRHLVHFGLKMLYLAKPSRAVVNAYLQKIANRLCQVIFVSD